MSNTDTIETVTKTLGPIRKIDGIAGSYAYTARVTYAGIDWSETSETTFVGNIHGTPGPVVVITGDGMQSFVIDPSRFGDKLTPQWIRNYYGKA